MRITGVCLLVMVMAAVGCHKPVTHSSLPPSEMLAHPGPGVDGPGPGVLTYQPAYPPVAASSQIYFVGPEGLTVQWDVTAPGSFDSEQLVAPARYNFPQGAMYRLKLANIPNRPGVELFPSLEVGPAMPRTEAFLAHNAIPVEFTDEDFDQVMTGNFVTKVIYLPDPEFQEMALAGVGTLVSTRLDPGQDPIVEADRKGAIMAVVRLGNKDLAIASAPNEEMPGFPMGMQGPYPPGFVAGATAPQYGMPITGTPIGLAGPPHVPLGVPAGLKEHTMVNHTHVCLPKPVTHERIDVKQVPGISYPEPANHVRIVERTTSTHPRPAPCATGGTPCPTDGQPSVGVPAGVAPAGVTPTSGTSPSGSVPGATPSTPSI